MPNYTPENMRLVALLLNVSKKDHKAFTQLYNLTNAHLYGVAMRMVLKKELADEILQDAFINIWQQAGRYTADFSTPMTWLISVVRNKSLDYLRKTQPQLANIDSPDLLTPDVTHDEAAEHVGPHELLASAMETAQLRRYLNLLDPSQRQSIALAYYGGLSHAELAKHLRVPLGTAKAWVRRGLFSLKHLYHRCQ
jgi:RNA polymerase sigma-70 factor (ECF subfamily)